MTEISGSRRKAVLYLVGSLAFVAIGLWELRHFDGRIGTPHFVLAFFGLCAVVFAAVLIRPERLVLDDEGFTRRGGIVWSPKKIYWRDVDRFFVYRAAWGVKMVGFNYKPGARDVPSTAKLNRLFGAEGALSTFWARSPEKMVEELNAYCSRAMSNGVSASR